MFAHVGDRLIVEGDPARAGLIIGVPNEDGSPPYIVRWLANGHVAMVSPGQFARIVPAEGRRAGPTGSQPPDRDRRASNSAA
jgi:hypothetical protein